MPNPKLSITFCDANGFELMFSSLFHLWASCDVNTRVCQTLQFIFLCCEWYWLFIFTGHWLRWTWLLRATLIVTVCRTCLSQSAVLITSSISHHAMQDATTLPPIERCLIPHRPCYSFLLSANFPSYFSNISKSNVILVVFIMTHVAVIMSNLKMQITGSSVLLRRTLVFSP